MIVINIYANFDILYLLDNMNVKYTELSFYEINVLLYLAKLLSIYDGNVSSCWKYDFTNSDSGAPISREILSELEILSKKSNIETQDDIYFMINAKGIIDRVKLLSGQYTFRWRTKYIEGAISATLSKSIPKVMNAIQNEPGIQYYRRLERSGILHDGSDKEIDSLFNDFMVLKEVVGDSREQIFVPASIWIEYLSQCGVGE